MFEVLWLCALAILAYYVYSKSPTIRVWVGKIIDMVKAAVASKTPAVETPVEETPVVETPAPVEDTQEEETPAPEE